MMLSDESKVEAVIPELISLPQNTLKALLDEGRPGGSSFDVQVFQNTQDQSRWIGKCGYRSANNPGRQASQGRGRYYDEYREWLGLAMYRHLGIKTPDFAVSSQPVAPAQQGLLEQHAQRPCLHIMTRFEERFQPVGEQFLNDYQQAVREKRAFMVDGRPLVGFGASLAMAGFVFDLDCLGPSGGNLGYVVNEHQAQVVKIDPGMAFSFLEEHTDEEFKNDNPMKREVAYAPRQGKRLPYSELTSQDQAEFSATAKRILKTPRAVFVQLVQPIIIQDGWTQAQANQWVDQLVARKSLFIAGFSKEIDQGLQQEIAEAKQRLLQNMLHKATQHDLMKEQLVLYRRTLEQLAQWEAERASAVFIYTELDPQQKQKIFQQPHLDPDFLGRKDILARLNSSFSVPSSFVIHSIQGIAGMGKTQCAAWYAWAAARHESWIGKPYDHILWLHAEIELNSQLQALAQSWGLSHSNHEETIASVRYKLKHRRFLLILDNAHPNNSDLHWVQALGGIGGRTGCCHVLMTTQSPNLASNIFPRQDRVLRLLKGRYRANCSMTILERFEKSEGRAYITRRLKTANLSTESLDALIDSVDGIPLALSQAVQYIASGHSTLEDYPQVFAQHQLSFGVGLTDSPVLTTMLLPFYYLRADDSLVEPLLIACAYLASEGMTFEMLQAFPLIKEQTPEAVQATLKRLHQYGLIMTQDSEPIEYFSMHRLTQLALRNWHRSQFDPASQEQLLLTWGQYFFVKLSRQKFNVLPDEPNKLLNRLNWFFAELDHREFTMTPVKATKVMNRHHDTSVKKSHQGLQGRDTTTVKTMKLLTHHPLAIANFQGIKTEKMDAAQAILFAAIAAFQHAIGDESSAQSNYMNSLAKEKMRSEPDNLLIACVHLGLANVLQNQDRGLAKSYAENALIFSQEHYGLDHPITAQALSTLSSILLSLGEVETAMTCAEYSLKVLEKHYGASHESLASVLVNMTHIAITLKCTGEAIPYAKRSLKIFKACYGDNHLITIQTYINYGILLNSMPYAMKGLKSAQLFYGPDQKITAAAHHNVGCLLFIMGQSKAKLVFADLIPYQYYQRSREHLNLALDILLSHYDPYHPRIGAERILLAKVLLALRLREKAKVQLEQAFDTFMLHYGPENNATRSTQKLLEQISLHKEQVVLAEESKTDLAECKVDHVTRFLSHSRYDLYDASNVSEDSGWLKRLTCAIEANERSEIQKLLEGRPHTLDANASHHILNSIVIAYHHLVTECMKEHPHIIANPHDLGFIDTWLFYRVQVMVMKRDDLLKQIGRRILNGIPLEVVQEMEDVVQETIELIHPASAIISNTIHTLDSIFAHKPFKWYRVSFKLNQWKKKTRRALNQYEDYIVTTFRDVYQSSELEKVKSLIASIHLKRDQSAVAEEKDVLRSDDPTLEEKIIEDSAPPHIVFFQDDTEQKRLAKCTLAFMHAMELHLDHVLLPSSTWRSKAPSYFVAITLKMIREERFMQLLDDPARYNLPFSLVNFIKNYKDRNPILDQAAQYPIFCKERIEPALLSTTPTITLEHLFSNHSQSLSHDNRLEATEPCQPMEEMRGIDKQVVTQSLAQHPNTFFQERTQRKAAFTNAVRSFWQTVQIDISNLPDAQHYVPQAAASFTATMLRAHRKDYIEALYKDPENYAIPLALLETLQQRVIDYPTIKWANIFSDHSRTLEEHLLRHDTLPDSIQHTVVQCHEPDKQIMNKNT